MPKQPKRLRLKGWLTGESLREQIKKSKSTDEIVTCLYSYLDLTYKEKEWDKLPWREVADFYDAAIAVNSPRIAFPMTTRGSGNTKESPWEYTERTWYLWVNMLAGKYSWSMEYIAELDIDDAIGLLQEILVEEQLEKEWQWDLAEVTYSYNSDTKQSEHKNYPRPSWMLPEPAPIRKTKIPVAMMPVGLGFSWEEDVKH